MEIRHNPLQENSFERAGGPQGFQDGGSGFQVEGEEPEFNLDGDNNGAPIPNDGFGFNTNRYQRGTIEEERSSLVNNPPV